MPDHSPELQPEVWAHIIKYLRKTPPPQQREAEWKDLHQHDLAMISLVSSTLHELAIPHLYTSVACPDLPSLLQHIDNPLSSLKTKITSKRDRLERVKHLRIAALGPPTNPAWDMIGLLNGRYRWSSVGETVGQFDVRMAKELEKEYSKIESVLIPLVSSKRKLKMPLLDSIAIGHPACLGWELAVGRKARFMTQLPGRHRTSQAVINDIYRLFNPRVICAQAAWSPYSPCLDTTVDTGKLEMVCAHHSEQLGNMPQRFYPNVPNRHYFDPACNFEAGMVPSEASYKGKSSALSLVMSLLGARSTADSTFKGQIQKTAVDIIGACVPLSVTSFTPGLPGGSDEERRYEEGIELEERLAKGYRDTFEMFGALPNGPMVDVVLWNDSPACDGCGWSKEDALQMFHV